jgi:SAM-dependent methyltransferase
VTSSENNSYGALAGVYDHIMWTVPHSAWLSRIERDLRDRRKRPRSVFDIACGTGLGTEILYSRGYSPVYGADLSPEMISVARDKANTAGSAITYFVQNAEVTSLPGGLTVDLVTCLFDALNYVTTLDGLHRVFTSVAQTLNVGGVFAFDLNAPYALRQGLFNQEDAIGNIRHVWKATWDEESRLCTVNMDFWRTHPDGSEDVFSEQHVQRAHTKDEVRDGLRSAGFHEILFWGNYADKAPNSKSDRWLVTAVLKEKPE